MKISQQVTYDKEYTMLLRGFEVAIKPSETEGFYTVTLNELGSEVFNEDVPIAGTDIDEISLLNNTAQAAIDMFEASRSTLGQGAGAMIATKKIASLCCDYSDWFMRMKGTPYEDTAYGLIDQYLLALRGTGNINSVELAELCERKRDLTYQLQKLDLERIRSLPAGTQIIIIKGTKVSYLYETEAIEEYLSNFSGCPLESEAVKLVKEYLEVQERINDLDSMSADTWDAIDDIEYQMDQLSIEALQSQIVDKIPTEGIEAFPNMAGDLAELMEGISLEEPLIPMANEILAKNRKKSFEEVEPVEDRIQELGEFHKGLDPAEALEDISENKTFNEGDKVSLTKEWNVPGWASEKKLPKGSKGIIDSLYDRQAEFYMVRVILEKGRTLLTKIPSKILKKG